MLEVVEHGHQAHAEVDDRGYQDAHDDGGLAALDLVPVGDNFGPAGAEESKDGTGRAHTDLPRQEHRGDGRSEHAADQVYRHDFVCAVSGSRARGGGAG